MINYPRSEEPGASRAQPRVEGNGAPRDPGPRVLASGWRTSGPEVEAFEREFAAYVGVDQAVAVSSGAVAIELALRAMRLRHGSRVLVSTLAPSSVLQAVVRAALRPVLLDVDLRTGMSTPDDVGATLRAGESPPQAVVASHWGGNPCDAGALAEAAGLPTSAVVVDAGQAIGARFDGQGPGALGTTCFSFYTTASLPIGEGGMLTTADVPRARRLRRQRAIGSSPAARRHVLSGHAAPHVLRQGGLQDGLTEQSAATGRDRLRQLDRWQRRRQDIARRYDERLLGVPGVGLPHRPASGTGVHGWQQYPILLDGTWSERDTVVRALRAAGLPTVAPASPLHRLDYARDLCESGTGLPGADRFVDRLVCLPMHPSLPDAAVDRVGEVLEATATRR